LRSFSVSPQPGNDSATTEATTTHDVLLRFMDRYAGSLSRLGASGSRRRK
jgi:hypothetical protein